MVFKERGKPEYAEKTLWQQEREPTDSPTDVLRGSSRVPAPVKSVSGAVTRDEPLRTSAWEANGVDARICTGARCWEASALTTAPPLLPKLQNELDLSQRKHGELYFH